MIKRKEGGGGTRALKNCKIGKERHLEVIIYRLTCWLFCFDLTRMEFRLYTLVCDLVLIFHWGVLLT